MITKRQISPLIQQHLEKKQILALLGPRQVGKTTLINHLLKQLNIPPNRLFKFSLDDPEILARWQADPKQLIRTVELSLNHPLTEQKEKIYLFIDEAQKAPAIFDILKILYDNYSENIKIIISGSSSLLIRQKSAETLAGRINFFHLHPLSWREIVSSFIAPLPQESSVIGPIINLRTNWQDLLSAQAIVYRELDRLNLYWQKLVIYGGLPEIFLTDDTEQKTVLLRDYLKTYLEKDIRLLSEIGDVDLFTRVLTSFILQDSQLLNLTKLAEQFGVNRHTLRKYYSILKETFLLRGLSPFTLKHRGGVVKSDKIIFFDNGLVNYSTKTVSWEQLKIANRLGLIIENIIINNLFAAIDNLPMPPNVNYWRDYQGHEIDLVISWPEGVIPIEITLSDKLTQNKIRNLKAFWKKHSQSPYGIIIYSGELQKTLINNKPVYLIPFWMWW